MLIIDQSFVTLEHLWLNLSFILSSKFTNFSETTVGDYFWKWIDIMFAKLSFLISWPDRESELHTLPAEFRARYPQSVAIIDCTEIFIEQPQTYSKYKKHFTVIFDF